MTDDPNSNSIYRIRKQAAEAGLVRFYTGIPCVHGHTAERYTSNAICVTCQSLREQVRDQRNAAGQVIPRHRSTPEEIAERHREIQEERDRTEEERSRKGEDQSSVEKGARILAAIGGTLKDPISLANRRKVVPGALPERPEAPEGTEKASKPAPPHAPVVLGFYSNLARVRR